MYENTDDGCIKLFDELNLIQEKIKVKLRY